VQELVLVAYDEHPTGRIAFERALELAAHDGRRLHLLAVAQSVDAEVRSGIEHERAHLAAVLEDLRARALMRGVPATAQVAEGPDAVVIAEVARTLQARLIVIGHRHRDLLHRMGEMSVAKRVIDRAPCEVLVVGEPASS